MYDITALGEILIDFTYQGISRNGQKLFAQNPGGAPANALTSAARFGAKTAFLGKAGMDMHFLCRQVPSVSAALLPAHILLLSFSSAL